MKDFKSFGFMNIFLVSLFLSSCEFRVYEFEKYDKLGNTYNVMNVFTGEITNLKFYEGKWLALVDIQKLKELFELPIGYQDHCDANEASAFWLPAASIGMGISVLEKHITHDRNFKGIDHESALNPDEFAEFVNMVNTIEKAKGVSIPRKFSDDERKYREFQKKSIVATHDMESGALLTQDDLTFMRAETLGISPDQIESVIGRRLTKPILAYEAISRLKHLTIKE